LLFHQATAIGKKKAEEMGENGTEYGKKKKRNEKG
jgi:hypothetical protein